MLDQFLNPEDTVCAKRNACQWVQFLWLQYKNNPTKLHIHVQTLKNGTKLRQIFFFMNEFTCFKELFVNLIQVNVLLNFLVN